MQTYVHFSEAFKYLKRGDGLHLVLPQRHSQLAGLRAPSHCDGTSEMQMEARL